MLKLFSSLSIAVALLPFLGAAPALALSPVAFVSGKGTDTGTCASHYAPCRTFQFALSQTSPGGEIKALDPAPYHAPGCGLGSTNFIRVSAGSGAGAALARPAMWHWLWPRSLRTCHHGCPRKTKATGSDSAASTAMTSLSARPSGSLDTHLPPYTR